MRLFLVRHGETESNRRGLALGRADVALNQLGAWQIARLAAALAAEPLRAVYSSPLERTMHTAAAIAAPHGLDIQVEEGLIEMDIGDVEGLTFTELREKHPELLHNWGGPDGPTFRMPGGETLAEVQLRAWGAVLAIATSHPEDSVCAVTHNFIILSVLARVFGLELANFRKLRHAVAAISLVEFRGENPRIERLNDTCHLTPD